jgi:biotin synthase
MSGWTKKEIIEKLRLPDPAPLFAEADAVRLAVHGRRVHLRALLETGNACRADCLYCGLRRSNASLPRYSLDSAAIVAVASAAAAGGFRTIVMQAGEDARMQPEFLSDVVAAIRRRTGAAVTLSYGEWPAAVFGMWRRAGADRYLLKFETSNRDLFSRLRPGRTLEERLACLELLREAGYQVGTGFMVGLPGQSLDDMANDLLLLRELDPDMAGIGPYIPHPGTPLGKRFGDKIIPGWRGNRALSRCDAGAMTLRCLALARVMNPRLHLPATTALGVSLEQGYVRGLAAGANVLMLGVTPGEFQRYYDIYPGRRPEAVEDPSGLRLRYEALLAREGYTVSADRGDGLDHGCAVA